MTMILALIWVHFVADFVLQTDAMALRKSKSIAWLAFHVLTYSLCLVPFGWRFAALNYAAHFCTDLVSSRATAALWQRGQRHWFFVVIGADQALHVTALVLTWEWLG